MRDRAGGGGGGGEGVGVGKIGKSMKIVVHQLPAFIVLMCFDRQQLTDASGRYLSKNNPD